ncbi:hypothetical protein CGRA01v4_14551 [Colletotrichum graminicola]|nr:hypothetical protein CGRA01v4_14551 [Colletotrichum graminicola]
MIVEGECTMLSRQGVSHPMGQRNKCLCLAFREVQRKHSKSRKADAEL